MSYKDIYYSVLSDAEATGKFETLFHCKIIFITAYNS